MGQPDIAGQTRSASRRADKTNGARGGGMVAGNHDRCDAGAAAQPHGFQRLRPGRVHQPHQPQEAQFTLDAVAGKVRRLLIEPAKGHGQHPQAVGRHPLGGGQKRTALQNPRLIPAPLAGAARQQGFRRTFDIGDKGLPFGMQGRHQLALRIERQFVDTGRRHERRGLGSGRRHGGLQQGGLGRVAHPCAGLVSSRVIIEQQGPQEIRRDSRIEPVA